ncbi:hypothetical protein BDV33DRAFT_108513 [Aspergillus novoparasiticus]|uniref:Uncharacterized protein n=1 Tax=Aspergillus novoparasiticus TaxID=986946 RepID=A0A5N6ESS0_9EURO|nr:hypothetical protein BDV33DRAFT_108513 [Aspergillus novoparasiticus]
MRLLKLDGSRSAPRSYRKLYQYLKTTLRDTSSLTDELSRIGALSSAVQVTKRPHSRGPVLLPENETMVYVLLHHVAIEETQLRTTRLASRFPGQQEEPSAISTVQRPPIIMSDVIALDFSSARRACTISMTAYGGSPWPFSEGSACVARFPTRPLPPPISLAYPTQTDCDRS